MLLIQGALFRSKRCGVRRSWQHDRSLNDSTLLTPWLLLLLHSSGVLIYGGSVYGSKALLVFAEPKTIRVAADPAMDSETRGELHAKPIIECFTIARLRKILQTWASSVSASRWAPGLSLGGPTVVAASALPYKLSTTSSICLHKGFNWAGLSQLDAWSPKGLLKPNAKGSGRMPP